MIVAGMLDFAPDAAPPSDPMPPAPKPGRVDRSTVTAVAWGSAAKRAGLTYAGLLKAWPKAWFDLATHPQKTTTDAARMALSAARTFTTPTAGLSKLMTGRGSTYTPRTLDIAFGRPAQRGEELRRHDQRRVPYRDHRRRAPLPPGAPRGHHEAADERAGQLPHRRRQGRGEQGRPRARRSRRSRTRRREPVRRRPRRRRTRPQRAVPAASRRPRRHEPAVPGGRRGETHHPVSISPRATCPASRYRCGSAGRNSGAATRWCRQSVRQRTSRWCPTRNSVAASA